MFSIFNNPPQIVSEAGKARFKPNIIIQILIFIAVFLICQIVSAIPLFIISIANIFSLISSGQVSLSDMTNYQNVSDILLSDTFTIISLFCTLITTVLVIIYCRFIEKRSLYSMGFVKSKALSDYLYGMLIGLILISISVGIAVLSGGLSFSGFGFSISAIPLLLAFFLGYFVQGMSEEVMLRGYLLTTLSSAKIKNPLLYAVIINSVLFSLMHIINPGFSLLAFVNIILFGIFVSVYMLKTNSIWGVCAIHSIWNFTLGNVYGIRVSGLNVQSSVFYFTSNQNNLFSGGSFGLEEGLAVTITLAAAIFLILLKKKELPSQ